MTITRLPVRLPVKGASGGGGGGDVPLEGISAGGFFAMSASVVFNLSGAFGTTPTSDGNRLTSSGTINLDYTFTAGDITSATQDGSSARSNDNVGGAFYNNGNNFAYTSATNNQLYTATCSTPYKRSTAGAFTARKNLITLGLPAGLTTVAGLDISNDGVNVYVTDFAGKLVHFSTPNAYDFTQLVYESFIDLGPDVAYDCSISRDGKYILVSSTAAGEPVRRFELSTPFVLSSAGAETVIDLSSIYPAETWTNIRGIQVDTERKVCYVSTETTNRIYQINYTG